MARHQYQGPTAGVSFDQVVKYHGKASLRIQGAPEEMRAALQLAGNAVEAGTCHVLRAWVKTENVAGEAALALQPHAEGQPLPFQELGEASRLCGTHDWTLLPVHVPPLPPDAVRVYAYVWVKGSGTAWFDEFALTEEGVEVPLGGQCPLTEADYAGVRWQDDALPDNVLANSSFEEGLAGWYVEHGTPVVDETTAASGRRSLRCDGFPECCFSVVQVRVRIDPRRAYRLSLMVKTELQAGLSCVLILPLRADGLPIGWYWQDYTNEFCYGRGVPPWHEESVILRAFAPEVDAVHVFLELQDAVGKVWFDDVGLTPLSLAETARLRGGG